jgi:hypothetical protein
MKPASPLKNPRVAEIGCARRKDDIQAPSFHPSRKAVQAGKRPGDIPAENESRKGGSGEYEKCAYELSFMK